MSDVEAICTAVILVAFMCLLGFIVYQAGKGNE